MAAHQRERRLPGTAFAIGKRYFLTTAHIFQGLVEADFKRLVLTRRGSAADLTVNYGNAALSTTYDLAVFTTRETVEHVLELVYRGTAIGGSRHCIVGYPKGRFAVVRQAEGIVKRRQAND